VATICYSDAFVTNLVPPTYQTEFQHCIELFFIFLIIKISREVQLKFGHYFIHCQGVIFKPGETWELTLLSQKEKEEE
jgi:hypothetical protein